MKRLTLLLLFVLCLAGCDGEYKPPSQSKIPYSEQFVGYSESLIEIDYAGRRHVFVRTASGQGRALAKLGDYPIPIQK